MSEGLNHEEFIAKVEDGTWYYAGQEEYGFSASPCEICGDPLAGNRYQAWAFEDNDIKKDVLEYRVCERCLHYLANGEDIDDL